MKMRVTKRVFATVKWYNLCLQIIQTQTVLSAFLFLQIKRFFKTFSLRCYVALLMMWRRCCFHGINAMVLMPQFFDVIANENASYKRNELECNFAPYINTFVDLYNTAHSKKGHPSDFLIFKYLSVVCRFYWTIGTMHSHSVCSLPSCTCS